jgi:hypothetical protein
MKCPGSFVRERRHRTATTSSSRINAATATRSGFMKNCSNQALTFVSHVDRLLPGPGDRSGTEKAGRRVFVQTGQEMQYDTSPHPRPRVVQGWNRQKDLALIIRLIRATLRMQPSRFSRSQGPKGGRSRVGLCRRSSDDRSRCQTPRTQQFVDHWARRRPSRLLSRKHTLWHGSDDPVLGLAHRVDGGHWHGEGRTHSRRNY